jgi:hypothetical protein
MDYDKILFSTKWPIDKVVATGNHSFVVNNPGGSSYTSAHITAFDSISNPYGKRALVRFVWSIDGVNYYSPETRFGFTFNINATATGGSSTNTLADVKAAAAMGVSDSSIKFCGYNGFHSDVVYTLGADSYTPYSLTFYFKYAVFELS